ncbi:uncharacterized protein E0L32_008277 [Thyridium curvatum]|uniref:Uncharacterized protein n=1 Tax=Thyridium curvatum TaxID=1093900 RepID=A0A507B169_9PEZI|nr:uncharacterized protein E0L32_008277 [Thyridium curvatum]TPX10708.1 hypothetical protein E0L32_008277 [Thyridium curvatum]
MTIPDVDDREVFLSFTQLPEVGQSPTPDQQQQPWYLVAQVKDDMTINKPTLVLTDRDGSPFALVFEGLERDGLDLKRLGLKKGATAVVPRARRTPPKEAGKRGFVAVEKGRAAEVRAVPGPLEEALELARRMRAMDAAREAGQAEDPCAGGCGKGGEGGGLVKCTGCGRVRYCGKVSESSTSGEG